MRRLDGSRSYLAGQWRIPHGAGIFEHRDPWTVTLVARVVNSTAQDAKDAAEAAAEAQRPWAALKPEQRARVFQRAAALVESQQDALVGELIAESGSTFGKARFEVGDGAALLREAATQVDALQTENLASAVPGKRSLQERVPLAWLPSSLPGTSLSFFRCATSASPWRTAMRSC
jgi:acyl-CoA reductase-like NAD-dependent aldehyde dehydrogenase